MQLTKAKLTEHNRRLLEIMQRLNFGKIEGLRIANGEPVLEPGPRLIRDIKLGGDNGPRPELERDNFELKTQVVELLEHFAELGNGTIEFIEVRHGLPFKLVLEQMPPE